jgi:hypothetical protein
MRLRLRNTDINKKVSTYVSTLICFKNVTVAPVPEPELPDPEPPNPEPPDPEPPNPEPPDPEPHQNFLSEAELQKNNAAPQH